MASNFRKHMVDTLFDFSSFLDRQAIVSDNGEAMTYHQLQEQSDKIQLHLQDKKLAFCLCTNRVASVAGYVALMQKRVATVLLDAKKDQDLMRNLLAIYQPNYIWAPTGTVPGAVLYEYQDYTLYEYSKADIDINPELALLLTTSGSTGSPKLVRLSQKNLKSNAESIAEYLHIDEYERPVTSLPMYYSYGMSVINSHFIKGATLLMTEMAVMQREFWDFVKQERATSIAGVPYTYEILRRFRFMQKDLPDMKTMIQAGGKLNVDIAKIYIDWAKEQGKQFIVMYGQTEAAPRMSYLPFEQAQEKYASIGIAIPGGRFSLMDGEGNEITGANIDGELVYYGDNVCLGYATMPADLALGDENHGVLHTGDVARRDGDGYYYITGRMNRFVKVWGNRVNLDAVEQLVKPISSDCAVTGVDDKITVFITDESLAQQVRNYLKEKTGLNVQAFDVKTIMEIPKKSSGKTDYKALAAI